MADEQTTILVNGLHEEGSSPPIVGIKELVDLGLDAVPPVYIRPLSDRPVPASGAGDDACRIPIINLAALASDPCGDAGAGATAGVGAGAGASASADADTAAAARQLVVQQIGCACEEWGFFQVVNHGVEPSVIQGLREAAGRFFDLPAEERMRFHSQSFGDSVVYSTSFNPRLEKVREWRDTLSCNRFPGVCDGFLEAPQICRKEVQQYIVAVEALAGRLYEAVFESLGLGKACIGKEVPAIPRVLMGINYYPPCPDPSLTLGLGGHSDVSCLTILHPDMVTGLEIKHKGMWVPVSPADPSAFVVNLADQTEILTNGKYKSIEHRVVTNREKARMSIACFFGPHEETIVAPLPALLNDNNPPQYKPTKFRDYTQNFASNRLLSNRGTLDFARI